jgi:hypothetical protein
MDMKLNARNVHSEKGHSGVGGLCRGRLRVLYEHSDNEQSSKVVVVVVVVVAAAAAAAAAAAVVVVVVVVACRSL